MGILLASSEVKHSESRLWKERQKELVKTLGSFSQKLAQSIGSATVELITCTGLGSSRKEPA